MVTVERTYDMELVRQAIVHPRVYAAAADDGSPPPDEFQPTEHPAIIYLAVHVGRMFGGVFTLVPVNTATLEVHTALLPEAWGAAAVSAQQAGMAWVWENTNARRIITQVPAFNTLARRYAQRAGFTPFGINPRSFLRDGQLHDIVLLGISKEQ